MQFCKLSHYFSQNCITTSIITLSLSYSGIHYVLVLDCNWLFQLFDLFTLDSGKGGIGQESSSTASTKSHTLGLGAVGAKAVLESLPDLWDEDQYDSEYDLDAFMSALKKPASS